MTFLYLLLGLEGLGCVEMLDGILGDGPPLLGVYGGQGFCSGGGCSALISWPLQGHSYQKTNQTII